MMARRGRALPLLLCALLTACSLLREPARVPATPAAAAIATEDYGRLAGQGQPVFRVDPAQSIVVIEVRRAGSLAQLGHDHVVASRAVEGFIAPSAGRADFAVALDSLQVDEPALRQAAHMESEPSADDVAATRRNMLGPVLDAARHPLAVVSVRNAVSSAGTTRVPVALTLHGATRSVDATVQVEMRQTETTLTGTFSIDQTDFGIVPYSLLGGAIAVRDRVDVRFSLVARAMPGS